MSNSTENTAALGAAEQETEEESLVLKFRKPYKFEGQEYTEVDLSGMEDMTARGPVRRGQTGQPGTGRDADPGNDPALCHVYGGQGQPQARGVLQGPAPGGGHEVEKPGHGFSVRRGWRGVNPPEIKKGCVALSLRLHSGVDYFLGLPLDDLNDMAKVVLEIGKKQGHGTGHKNRRKGR